MYNKNCLKEKKQKTFILYYGLIYTVINAHIVYSADLKNYLTDHREEKYSLNWFQNSSACLGYVDVYSRK